MRGVWRVLLSYEVAFAASRNELPFECMPLCRFGFPIGLS